MDVKIEPSWKAVLEGEFSKDYFKELTSFVKKEYMNEKVYPTPKNIFRAFDLTSFDSVKVVILGQDPYHGAGQAIGLSFAVNEGVTLPPSLRNIYKETESDLGTPVTNTSGDLTRWAEQGVLLLNATLTVRASPLARIRGVAGKRLPMPLLKPSPISVSTSYLSSGEIMRAKKARISIAKSIWSLKVPTLHRLVPQMVSLGVIRLARRMNI